jgi:hypothetical protein
MAKTSRPKTNASETASREDRLKAALKQNLAKRKAQALVRAAGQNQEHSDKPQSGDNE